jgi:serine/threonine-protein kinase
MGESGHERLIGRTIAGKFLVERLLGTGAMGAVFRARQVALEKTVAIKVLHGEHANDATFAARFHREAKAASRLNHPNSMQVIDFGAEPDGLLYIAMEYLHGRSLHHVLRDEWPLPTTRIADILMQTLAALAVAHDMGVVHRDLKPENIMVLAGTDDDGRPKDLVKVCDFGIAKITDSRAYRDSDERESNPPVTTAGFLVGTPEYMSPEQGRGERLDSRSDLYSVGIILFEMLTRRVPFEAENAIGVVLKHVTEVPPRPSEFASGVDRRLEAICLRALCKTSQQRYGSAREMRAELRAIVAPTQDGALRLATPAATLVQSPFAEDVAIAPTMHMQTPGPTGYTEIGSAPKATLLEASTTIPGVPSRRALFVVGAALATAASIAVIAFVMARSPGRAAPSSATTPVDSTRPAAILTLQSPEVTTDTTRLDPLFPGLPGAPGTVAAPTARSKAPAGKSAQLPPMSLPTATAPQPAVPTPAPVVAATAPPVAAAMLPMAPTSSPEVPDPSFDPERGFVEVGLVNAQGARESAVRGALRGIGLVRCYRAALRARGARETGMATLNLSFDETGFARSAIVTGADFLPGLTRCLQAACTGVRIPRSQVDPSGGTAEVFLAFKSP